jgi:dihydrofolate reductase
MYRYNHERIIMYSAVSQQPPNGKANDDEIEFVDHDVIEFVEQPVYLSGKDIWLIGGSEIKKQIYCMILSYPFIPKFLAKALPIFRNTRREMNLILINC